jgi:O-antigen/teichoic acid export membrane protein
MKFIRTLNAKFLASHFARNVTTLTFGTTFAQGIAIASTPILSRLYSPEEFGSLAVFLAVSGIVATTITLRYETAILLPKDNNEATVLVLLSGALTILLGVLIGIVAWLLPESAKAVLGVSILSEWLLLAVLCGISTALISVGSSWYNRQRDYKKISWLRIIQSGILALGGILLGLWGFSSGLILAQIVAGLTVSILVIFNLRALRAHGSSYLFCKVANQYQSTPKYLLPTAFLDVVTMQLPVILITRWFGSEAAGQFSMAWKILALPLTLVGSAVGQVFIQRFAEVWPDAKAAKRLLLQTWKALALVGLLPTAFIMLFGERLFSIIFGDVWSEAGRIATVIAPMLFAMLISSPTSGTFLVLGLQKYSLIFGIFVLIYRPICIWIGFLKNDLIYGLLLLIFLEVIQMSLYQFTAIKRIG